ncbi:MAG: hypothetical protein ABI478_04695 [Propionivibrio sp.]
MPPDAEALRPTLLPAGEELLDTLAAAILERYGAEVRAGDLSSLRVLVPSLPIAAELRAALLRAAPTAFLLPRFDTLMHWLQSTSFAGIPAPTSDCQRLVLLHDALRQRGWFDESALWGIAAEMGALFDELTTASVTLPAHEAALIEQLQAAYKLRDSQPLAFEARVVHALWGALAAAGHVDRAAAYARRLAALAERAERQDAPSEPLLVLLEAAPEHALTPVERAFLARYARGQPVSVFQPTPRAAASSPLLATLAAAWPEAGDADGSDGSDGADRSLSAPLAERAAALVGQYPQSPLAGRLQLVATDGREQEAQAAVAQVAAWLVAGLRRIALIAQDRLSARRVRALLEREGVLVSDETGWKLSTSRAD